MTENLEAMPRFNIEHIDRPLTDDELQDVKTLSGQVGVFDPKMIHNELKNNFIPERDVLVFMKDAASTVIGYTYGKGEEFNIDIKASEIDPELQKQGHIGSIMNLFESVAQKKVLKPCLGKI